MLTWKQLKKNPRKLMRSFGGRSSTPQWVGPAVGSFAAGLVIGVGLALLLAPKSGGELRQDIKQKLNEGSADETKNAEPVTAAR